MKYFHSTTVLLLGLLTLIVYGLGLGLDVMEVDAAQYASMSREMLETGNFLMVKNRYQDYLDKPPLLFWLSSLSFKFGGINNFFYKLPSFLGTLLGLFSCYKLGKLLYNQAVGYLAAWLLITCQAWFLFNHDIRTDTLLATGVIFAIWQLMAYIKLQKAYHFILGFLGITIAMLSKGPIGLMVPLLALGSQWLYERNWKIIFQKKWLLGLGIVLVLLLPMLWGLYQQYGTYGPYFYFWEQSFGRLTGKNAFIQSQAMPQPLAPFFFTHTFVWAFLPWSLLAIYAIVQQGYTLIRNRGKFLKRLEVVTLGGIVLPFIALSLSHYKLPHYIFVFFPLVAILTAHHIEKCMQTKIFPYLLKAQALVYTILWGLLIILGTIVFPLHSLLLWASLFCLLVASIYALFKGKNKVIKLLLPASLTIIGVNLFLNSHFYPTLHQYQSESRIGKLVYKKHIPHDQFYRLYTDSHALDFYAQRIVPSFKDVGEVAAWKGMHNKNLWLFTNTTGLWALEKNGCIIQEKHIFKNFHVTTLTYEFLNPKTRVSTLETFYLLCL